MEQETQLPKLIDSTPRIDNLTSTLLKVINVTEQEIGLVLELEAAAALKELTPDEIQLFATKFSKLVLYKEPGAAENHVNELLENNASGTQTFLGKTTELNEFLNKRKRDVSAIESKYAVKQSQQEVTKLPQEESDLTTA